MNWTKCLSHQIWPSLQKGWPETDKPVHFFWGLGGNNIVKINEIMKKGEEWWYVDVGYLTEQIKRYPEPSILDKNKTYFRIVKGKLHTVRGKVGNGQRLNELENKGIDVNFKGWNTGDTKHILLCPSSPTVTYHINGISQEDWINEVTNTLKQFTQREIRVRNKPRPGNQWWETDIKNELKDCHCLITNMSMAAIDAVLNKVPVICHTDNIVSPIASHDLKFIEKPLRPGRKTVDEWLKYVVENQFTIDEMANGTAYKTLKAQRDD
jgi:hypothetical protein